MSTLSGLLTVDGGGVSDREIDVSGRLIMTSYFA